ncbi:hypothetical protein Dimus_000330, partial [Dionaea muscipula]
MEWVDKEGAGTVGCILTIGATESCADASVDVVTEEREGATEEAAGELGGEVE